MGRKENPITSSNRALVRLARWLRDQRSASGCSYAELAARAGCHATTLQRAASGRSVPSAHSVRAYAQACDAPVDVAMQLWRQARRRAGRSAVPGTPNPLEIDGIDTFKAALREVYEGAGRPSVREMERRAGPGRLPHSTAHRIVHSRTVPRDVHQLTGFLTACLIGSAEHPSWIDAWRRALGQEAPLATAPRPPRPAPRVPPPEASRPAVPASGYYFTLLGPVRAWDAGQPLTTGSPQQQALLAALLLREGRTATSAELIDAIWGDEPPSQALAAVRTYASRLRKTLHPGALVSESGGYAIRLPARTLDVTAATDLCTRAEKARAKGDLEQARILLQQVLGLWEGEALAGIPGPYAATQRVRLQEWQLQILEARLDMDLECGLHARVVSELTALSAAHPLRERLRELLMLALYRSGRQAEALAVYADTRRLLADELGVDPRPALAELFQRILEADSALAEPRPLHPAADAHTHVPPAQLPAPVPDFTGRATVMAKLIDVLTAAERTSLPVAALSGTAGVGKSTLAVQAGHAVRTHFPDGQLYIDLHRQQPGAALGAALRALGVADQHVPAHLDERAALYRSLLAGRRMLVMVDHAHTAAEVRWLLPATAGCAVLVTSRRRMIDLAGAHLVELNTPSPVEALHLFTRIAGERRIADEPEAARYVAAACGFLPLAIRIAASRLAAHRTWRIAALAQRLADDTNRLTELQAGDLGIKPLLEHIYTRLDTEQARAFRLLSSTTNPFMSLPDAAGLLNRDPVHAETLLENLIDAGLLHTPGPGFYQVHVLARLFAITLTAP